jgi:3-phosphoshikimate 1-carboxyvinyltransferase
MQRVAMSSKMSFYGPGRLSGSISVPGDKSISHRVALLASIASGTSQIIGFASSADCATTLACLKKLGVKIERDQYRLLIHGGGLRGLGPAEEVVRLNCENSGSTIRMLSGILAAQPFTSLIDGDASLRQRPMRRIIEPLRLMGASIKARQDQFAPLEIKGGPLRAINYTSPIASAQVKTCVLLAGLYADGSTTFTEPARSRNHTEIMLGQFGARISENPPGQLSIEGGVELNPVFYQVPGDTSSAAFFIAAATVLPGSKLTISGVGLNPTRTAFIDVLNSLGADIKKAGVSLRHGEPVGELTITSRPLRSSPRGIILSGEIIPNIIDEIPILAVVATQVEGRVEVRGAQELRVKESDRIKTVVDGIRALGGFIEEFEDGFAIIGPQKLTGGRVNAAADHRIAMAFSIAGLIAKGTTEITGADSASISFPEFYDLMETVLERGGIRRW